MANELQTKLDAILNDKNTNLLPENLKAGITCLGIEGGFEGVISQEDYDTCEQIADNILGDTFTYDRLEYIITKEGSFITLPYKNNSNMSYEIDFQNIATPRWSVYLGDVSISMQLQNDSDSSYYVNHGGGSDNGTSVAYDTTRRLVYRQEKALCYFNNELKVTLGQDYEFVSSSDIYINAVDADANNSCNMKLYSFRLWDDDTTYCDLVPVKRSDGEVGMFDNITKTFYGSSTDIKFEVGGDL